MLVGWAAAGSAKNEFGGNFMKKIIAVLLAAAMMAVIAAGCTGAGESGTPSQNSGTGSESGTSAPEKDESWTKVKDAGRFVLGLDAEFPPMGFKNTETGEVIGFDIDVAKEACKRLGVEFVAQPINWDNKQMELDGGNIDCVWNGMSYTEERAKSMLVSKPYMKNEQYLLTLKSSEYKTMESLKGTTLGVQKDSSAESALNKNEAFKSTLGEVVGIENYTSALMELKNNTIQVVAIDEVVARYYLQNEPGAYQIVQDGKGENASLAAEDYVIGFRKGDTALMEKVYGALQEMKADGTLAEISNKWFEKDITTVE